MRHWSTLWDNADGMAVASQSQLKNQHTATEAHLGFKGNKLKDTLKKKYCCEADIESIKNSSVQPRFLVVLGERKSNSLQILLTFCFSFKWWYKLTI